MNIPKYKAPKDKSSKAKNIEALDLQEKKPNSPRGTIAELMIFHPSPIVLQRLVKVRKMSLS